MRAHERGRVGFHENSCRSFEASSSVRASHLAESESPGRPCNDAQVHAGQDSPFASPASRPLFRLILSLSLSLPFHLLLPPPPPLPPPSSSSSEQCSAGPEHLLLRRRASLDLSPHRAILPTFPLERHEAEDSTYNIPASHTFASSQLPAIFLLLASPVSFSPPSSLRLNS